MAGTRFPADFRPSFGLVARSRHLLPLGARLGLRDPRGSIRGVEISQNRTWIQSSGGRIWSRFRARSRCRNVECQRRAALGTCSVVLDIGPHPRWVVLNGWILEDVHGSNLSTFFWAHAPTSPTKPFARFARARAWLWGRVSPESCGKIAMVVRSSSGFQPLSLKK